MQTRQLGRGGPSVSALGVGMWGMAGWLDSDDETSEAALQAAVEAGVTFFDSALQYGDGRGDALLGRLVAANPDRSLLAATKIFPVEGQWPPRPDAGFADAYPADHVRASIERSRGLIGADRIGLLQFHTWEDRWAPDEAWMRTVDDIRQARVAGLVGISVKRGEPWNVLETLRSGLVDTVQVVYNVFDQAPQDELFPACRELGVGVIARVPFDEGSLTGTLTPDCRWPDGDWRNGYFSPANLAATLPRVEALRALLEPGEALADLALRFVVSNPDMATVIAGMRSVEHLAANAAAVEAGPLPADRLAALRAHRWDRGRRP
jgi:aryl-alcohol dehydrogenase-like predicted oxidoreductase